MNIPYLPVYNARPCIMRTPILDCTLEKKKRKQKTEEVVTKELRKKIWKHFKNDNSIISSEMSLDAPATKGAWTLLAVSLCKIMDTVRYPLHPAPRLLEEHYGLEN